MLWLSWIGLKGLVLVNGLLQGTITTWKSKWWIPFQTTRIKTKWNTKFRSVTDGVQYKNKMSRIKSLKPLLFQRITYILNVKIVSHISSVTVLESNFSNHHNILYQCTTILGTLSNNNWWYHWWTLHGFIHVNLWWYLCLMNWLLIRFHYFLYDYSFIKF